MKLTRYLAISAAVTLGGIGLLVFSLFAFPDHIVSSDPPPTVWEYAFRGVLLMVVWPTLIIAEVFGEPAGPAVFLLVIPSGLVWAALVELLLNARRRWKANEITGANSGWPARLPVWTRWAARIAQFRR